MTSPNAPEKHDFQSGQKIYLAEGPYQGTVGTFLALAHDSNWASIEQVDKVVRNHPVIWMRHCPPGELVWSKLLAPRNEFTTDRLAA